MIDRKNSLCGCNSVFEKTKERFSKLENKTIEIIDSEEQKEKRIK